MWLQHRLPAREAGCAVKASYNMTEHEDIRPSVQESLEQVIELLRKHDGGEPGSPPGRPRRNWSRPWSTSCTWSSCRSCSTNYILDVAYVLEALPLEQRLIVWDLVRAERDGEILLEVSDAVRETLIAHMDEKELVAATGSSIPTRSPTWRPTCRASHPGCLQVAAGRGTRAAARSDVLSEDSVGALMDFD